MPKQDRDKVMLVEHVLEVRHEASGTFLDIRGQIADYVRKARFLPHWKIDANVVNFRDEQSSIKTEGAFVGYKSAGYVVINPQTRNFFTDRASAFWRLLLSNPTYHLPEPTRFGMRTKVFVPSSQVFDQINKTVFENMFTERARALFGGNEKDLQFTIDLTEAGFDVRIMGGPIHKDEAPQYFQFEVDDLKKCGLFLDIDFYKMADLVLDAVPKLLNDAVGRMWQKAEKIAVGLGLRRSQIRILPGVPIYQGVNRLLKRLALFL
jgi:hypothetical protein